jgi:methylated-DNA-protein-cysteine methyltransferase related protein
MKYSDKTRNFFHDVYAVVRLIPEGRVTSYGAIANYFGSGGSSRMVGWAMNACRRETEPVPAHRVLNRAGMLTGKHYFDHPMAMQERLESEGIKVINDRVQDWDAYFWDPFIELEHLLD